MSFYKKIPYLNRLKNTLDPSIERENFIKTQLKIIPKNKLILDAGCGSQQYKKYCSHLKYYAQDFGKYVGDEKKSFNSHTDYNYGELDYTSDIWNIPESNEKFDYIICTEVLEHIPYPNKAIKELSRLLKKDGTLILSAPSQSLRHFDPYYFYSGFSDRYFEEILNKNKLKIETIENNGDYYKWMSTEILRTMMQSNIISKIILLPSLIFFYSKRETLTSKNAMCYGYHILAKKIK